MSRTVREYIAGLREDGDKYLLLQDERYDSCIVGFATRAGGTLDAVCYDADDVISILITADGMTEEEAIEFFEFNIVGAWVGDKTPVFVYRDEFRELRA